ncbi:LuxR C-terminal-related transcriptional regulator [Pseudomonas sp. H9]|uniref:LuxR C-terminal-related transcriptional regulator n=1 Tax=Pseudomonas sp. H9 TaxID=483968 RepID=UPI0014047228|nr:LuxR C-terminal-related transcriptional regulator [Pseudomonas sp. H9]
MSHVRSVNPLLDFSVDTSARISDATRVPGSPFKFSEPVASATHLPRETLLAHLARVPPRLLLACAPAGFGKTTFLLQYRQVCLNEGREVIWCNLDTADNDLGHFVQVVGARLAHLWQLPQVPLSPSQLLACFCQRETAYTLILDEFEVLDNPALLAFIQHLLDSLPAHGHLAIASRRAPDLNLGRLRARGQVQAFGQSSLRFSLEETRHYIRERCALSLRDDDIANLLARTEGWITALYLATLSLRWHDNASAFIDAFNGNNLEVAEYLSEDLLLHQDQATRQFLLDTCWLDTFCASLCDAVTGRDDGQAQLERLLQANLFVLPLDQRQHGYRYHPLFASFLRNLAEQTQPQLSADRHARAAHWYQQNGQYEPALEHFFAAGQTAQAVDLLATHADTWMLGGHARMLLTYLQRLPEDTFDTQPELGMVYIWALLHARRYTDVERLLARPVFSARAAIAKVQWLAMTDHIEDAYTIAQAQLHTLGTSPDAPSYVQLAYYLSHCMICTGRFDQARTQLARLPRQSNYLRNGADSLESLLDLHQGQLDSALERLRATEQRNQLLGEPATTSLQVCLSLLLYQCDQLTEARQRLEQTLPQIKEMSSPDALISAHVLLARMAALDGDHDTWMRYLTQLEQFGHQTGSRRMLCSAWLERARLATLANRPDTARHALRSAEQLGDWAHSGVLFYANEVDTPFIAAQRLAIAQGEPQAVPALRDALTQARGEHRLYRALKLQTLLALALDSCGEHRAALDELTEALRAASQVGFKRNFLDEGSALAALLERWVVTHYGQEQALAIAPGFVAQLQARMTLVAASHEVETDACEAGLTARELQVVRLLALGYRNREIAEKLFLSELTVKSHLRRVNAKLGAQGRTEAVAIARQRGLLD